MPEFPLKRLSLCVQIVLRFTEIRDFRYEVCESLWGLNESWNSREFALPPNFPRVKKKKENRVQRWIKRKKSKKPPSAIERSNHAAVSRLDFHDTPTAR